MRHCFVVRVFTRGAEGGNHLGIVTDLVELDDRAMQEIATTLGYSETIFVDMTGAVPHVRIFTPAMELPFAGHPLVGAAWLLNTMAPDQHSSLTCGIGSVELSWDGTRAWIGVDLNQPVRERSDFDGGALGIAGVRAVYEVDMPLSYVVVELEEPRHVGEYVPQLDVLDPHPDGQHLSIWAKVDDESGHTRFFAPKMGILEDPATGSAAVAIAATQRHEGRSAGSMTLLQGAEMGMPSEIMLRWDGARAELGGLVVHDGVRELD